MGDRQDEGAWLRAVAEKTQRRRLLAAAPELTAT